VIVRGVDEFEYLPMFEREIDMTDDASTIELLNFNSDRSWALAKVPIVRARVRQRQVSVDGYVMRMIDVFPNVSQWSTFPYPPKQGTCRTGGSRQAVYR
jgi:hypothetical protein